MLLGVSNDEGEIKTNLRSEPLLRCSLSDGCTSLCHIEGEAGGGGLHGFEGDVGS